MRGKDDYEDIIGLPHPVSKKHPPMPLLSRAAQFAPFAALRWTAWNTSLTLPSRFSLFKKMFRCGMECAVR